MRSENKPGDLAVRLTFGRMYGGGPDQGTIKPSIEITDQTSGCAITMDLTAHDIAELLAGGAVDVPAANVSGFKGLRNWGKYVKVLTRTVKVQGDDHKLRDGELRAKAPLLPQVAPVIAELERDGYRCNSPRRNNQMQWVIVGRRYDDQP